MSHIQLLTRRLWIKLDFLYGFVTKNLIRKPFLMVAGVKIIGIDDFFGILSDSWELSFCGPCGSCFWIIYVTPYSLHICIFTIHLLTSICTDTCININPSAVVILCGEVYGPYNKKKEGCSTLFLYPYGWGDKLQVSGPFWRNFPKLYNK